MRNTTLKRTTPLKARKRLRTISDKQAAKQAKWNVFTDTKIEKQGPYCQWCGEWGDRKHGYRHLCGHHIIPKSAGRIDTEENCYIVHENYPMGVNKQPCHSFITNNNIDVRQYKNKEKWLKREMKPLL